MGIHVCQSQKIEVIAAMLLAQVSQPSDHLFDVLQTQHFIVPNHAVEHWLTQYIAKQSGVSANQMFHHRIQTFQWYVYQQVLSDKDRVRQANMPRLVMKWRIYTVLLSLCEQEIATDHAMHALIQRIQDSYVNLTRPQQKQQKKQSMLYWVAEQLSKLFSHYMAYRGHCMQDHALADCDCRQNWLATWGRGQSLDIESLISLQHNVSLYSLEQANSLAEWQGWLWRELFHDDFLKIKAIDDLFWQTLAQDDARSQLPQHVIVFTVLDLPPVQLNFLRRLGQYIEVTIYHYNPSQEYWVDSVDPKWKKNYDAEAKQRFIEKNQQQGKKVSDQQIEAFLQNFNHSFNAESRESRHPLLTRLGKQARDHFSLLAGLSSGEEGEWLDAFVDHDSNHLLSQLQSDILYLLEPQEHSYVLDQADQSLQIHVCHSHLRQLEVLKEQLLHWLAEPDPQSPRRLDDILILTPALADIEPLVRSVFAPVPAMQGQRQADYLPIKISGVVQFDLSNAWSSVLGRIQLPEGRFQYSDFSDWLSLVATQRFYNIDYLQVERMLVLLQGAGFKRGLDEPHLKRTLLADDQDYRFSFKFALDRLVKGIAVPEHCMVLGGLSDAQVLPEDFILVGVLVQMYQDFNHRRDWLHAYQQGVATTVEQWLFILMDEVEAFEQQGEVVLRTVKEILQKQIRMLTLSANYEQQRQSGDMATLSGLTLPLASILEEIDHTIQSQLEQAVPSDAITLSAIGYIRPLPYRLVVVLNLESGLFPNPQKHVPFDLMQVLRPMLGDRSRLEDDQGAFLDALLLAKDALWLFYNGFDANDGEVRYPSSVLQELIDHLAFIVAEPEQATPFDDQGLDIPLRLQSLYQIHQLQPFDIKNFSDSSNVSYYDHWYDVALQLQQPSVQAMPWVDVVIDENKNDIQIVEQYQWLAEVTFPAKLYLNALGMLNLSLADVASDEEPLMLDGLARYQIRSFVQQQQQEINQDLLMDCLPVGKVQHSAWEKAQQEHDLLLDELHRYAAQPTVVTHDVLEVEKGLYIRIQVPDEQTSQWLSLQASSANAERRAKTWLEYLLWLSYLDLASAGTDLKRIVVFSDQTLICEGVSSKQAKEYLAVWWQMWHRGKCSPLVLPAALLLKPAQQQKTLQWLASSNDEMLLDEKSMKMLLKEWQNSYDTGMFSRSQDKASQEHQDWAFLLQQQDAAVLLQSACSAWSYALYAPIYNYQYEGVR